MEPVWRAREQEEQTGQLVGSLRKSDSRDLNKDSRTTKQAMAESSSMESLQAQEQMPAQKQSSIGIRQKISRVQGPTDEKQMEESM